VKSKPRIFKRDGLYWVIYDRYIAWGPTLQAAWEDYEMWSGFMMYGAPIKRKAKWWEFWK